jgi:hypothetical protein
MDFTLIDGPTMGPIAQLSREEIGEILASPPQQQMHLFVVGFVDYVRGEVALFQTGGKVICAPLSMFMFSPKCQPDFEQFSIIDCGNTLKFGNYEAASSAVLYELDPDYKAYADANASFIEI